jgi:hypothetical protein
LVFFYVRRNPTPAPERNGAAYLWNERPNGMSMDGSDSESNRPSDASEYYSARGSIGGKRKSKRKKKSKRV